MVWVEREVVCEVDVEWKLGWRKLCRGVQVADDVLSRPEIG